MPPLGCYTRNNGCLDICWSLISRLNLDGHSHKAATLLKLSAQLLWHSPSSDNPGALRLWLIIFFSTTSSYQTKASIQRLVFSHLQGNKDMSLTIIRFLAPFYHNSFYLQTNPTEAMSVLSNTCLCQISFNSSWYPRSLPMGIVQHRGCPRCTIMCIMWIFTESRPVSRLPGEKFRISCIINFSIPILK